MKTKKLQEGVALYISLMIMAFILSIGLGLTSIIVGQIRIMRGVGDSVVAFYAADTGIENALYNKRKLNQVPSNGSVGNANYLANYFVISESTAEGEKWQSLGVYKNVNRAIEIEQKDFFKFAIFLEPDYFCVEQDSEAQFTEIGELQAFLISGDPKHFTITIENLPPGVTVIFDPFLPEAWLLADKDESVSIFFQFLIDGGVTVDLQMIKFIANPDDGQGFEETSVLLQVVTSLIDCANPP